MLSLGQQKRNERKTMSDTMSLPGQTGSLHEPPGQMESLLEELRDLKTQIGSNRTDITNNALRLKCPLKEHELLKKGAKKPKGGHLAMQMKRVARGSDGQLYDFEALCRYIMENYETRLRSPVTGEDMSAEVKYTERCKQRCSKQRYHVKTWTPWLS